MNIEYDSLVRRYDASRITTEDARRIALAACGVAMLLILVGMIGAAWLWARADAQRPAWVDTAIAEGRN